MRKDIRVVRVPLPISLINRMDQLILEQVAGFESRAEFVKEAIDSFVVDLSYEQAPLEPTKAGHSAAPRTDELARSTHLLPIAPSVSAETLTQHIAGSNRIPKPGKCALVPSPVDTIADGPLFGLHNRDFPTIWALSRLSAVTSDGLTKWEDFVTDTVAEAWGFGALLSSLEKTQGKKLTALFPTNLDKKQAAEGVFRSFAIGRITEKEGAITSYGPFFKWNVARLEGGPSDLRIGLTAGGYGLLESLAGLEVTEPHRPEFARAFLQYLCRKAPADWWGFRAVLEAIAGGAGRTDVISALGEEFTTWTEAKTSTNAAGYVARAKEWGLVDSALMDRRYQLTELGSEMLSHLREDEK